MTEVVGAVSINRKTAASITLAAFVLWAHGLFCHHGPEPGTLFPVMEGKGEKDYFLVGKQNMIPGQEGLDDLGKLQVIGCLDSLADSGDFLCHFFDTSLSK